MGDKDNHLYGEVLEIIPNKKLVYTFIPDEEYRPDGVRLKSTLVTWSLEEVGKIRQRSLLSIPDLPKKWTSTLKMSRLAGLTSQEGL